MQLSVVQNDIRDVLAAVRNPPGKRKRRESDQNTGPTPPTNQRPATNKKRDASPEHSLMHSQHVTSAAQDALDTLMRKYPPRPLAITSTESTTDPLPDSNAVQDTTLPDAPTTTAPVEKDGWKTVEGKAKQKKRRNDRADNKRAATTAVITPPGHLRPRSPPLSPLRFASYRSHLCRSPSGHPRPFPPHLSPLLWPSFPASMPPLLASLPFLSSVL
jgi:hypothetical protein